MKTRSIGKLSASVVGLGCNNFGMRIDFEQTAAVVDAALDEGITRFDTADIYDDTKSEEFLGRALGARRTEIIIGTKFGMAIDADRQGARPDYVRRAVEDSLRRLRTDCVQNEYTNPARGRRRAAAFRCRGRRDSRLTTTPLSWPPCRPSSRHAGERCSIWRCPGWRHGRRCRP